MSQKGDPRPDWAKLELERARRSDSYRLRLSPGAERALALALWAHVSQFGPILDEDGEISIAGCGAPASLIRELMPRADFRKDGKFWVNENAMEYHLEAIDSIEKHRKGGRACQAKAKAEKASVAVSDAESVAASDALSTPLHSTSPSTEASVVGSSVPIPIQVEPPVQQSLAIVEKPIDAELVEPVVIPPLNKSTFEQLAQLYLRARAHALGNPPRAMSNGTVLDVAKKISKLKSLGFPSELLVSLPVFVKDGSMRDGADAVKAMLKDPLTLLRDEENGAKCWARRLEAQLDGMILDARRVSILQEIRTWEWAQRMGVQAKGAAA